MTKKHLRGRYAVAVRFAVVGLRTVELSLVLAGLLLAMCPRAFALNPALDVNQYAHTAWTVRDGFFKSEIRTLTQTPDGYLWLGSQFGLLRFDGVRTIQWEPPTDEHLPSDDITSLLAARDGTLWIGTSKGLASWKDGKLTQFPELAGRFVMRLLQDREGSVWASGVGLPNGKLCAIQKGSAHCAGEDGTLGHGAFGLYEDNKGNLWVGVKNGLWRWKPGPPRFYPVPGQPDGIQGFAEGDDGSLLLGTSRGIGRFVDGKVEPYPLPGIVRQFDVRRLLWDRAGGLWIAVVDGGLVHLHRGQTDVFSNSDGLSGEHVYAFLEDREGSIWVGTGGGLDRFRDSAVTTLTVSEGLSKAAIGSVLADKDGSVWLGTYDGLNRWKNGQITIYGKPSGQAKRTTNTVSYAADRERGVNGLAAPSKSRPLSAARERTIGKLPENGLESLFQDDRGRVWLSTLHQFGYLYNERFNSITAVTGGYVLSIVQDIAGNLWVANEHVGLCRLSTRGDVKRIPWIELGHKDYASVLAADGSRGGLWIGFNLGGIAYFDAGQIRESYAPADGLGEGRVGGFHFDQEGTLWIATEGGLSRLKNSHVITLSGKNGLPCDTVHWAMEDDAHSFWLYTACGLVRIDRSELDLWAAAAEKDKGAKQQVRATVFDSSDGVRSVSRPSHYSPQVAKTLDGRIWFLPTVGVSVIDPHHLPFNRLPPPVHIEQLTADRKMYDPASYAKGQVPLPARIRDLQIDYTALSLVAPEKVRFRYKLEGRDRDWQDAGNRRQAFYTDLPPRNYRFRVMACNNSGVWNETGAFLDFSVAPAYHQTWWFRLSLVAAFLAVLWGLYQLRLQQLAREFNAGVDARVSERTRIARELHDSMLQGFQGLMFRLQAVRDMLPARPSEAMHALDVALERGDKAIAEGRDTVSDLREPIMGDNDIAQALTALGEELAAQSDNGAAPCVRVLVEGKPRELNPVLRDEIYRIAREALRNAFRHARAQKIEAEITYGDAEFLLHVRDDGGGIDPAFANQGSRAGHWGLPGMRERAKSFGGKLEVWSEGGAGTEIELSVPAAIAYGKSNERRRFWFLRKKIGVTDGKQS